MVNLKLRDLLKTEISMVDMFQYPTITSLANYLGRGVQTEIKTQDVENRSKRQRDYFKKIKNKKE
jgi:hypothetical protein